MLAFIEFTYSVGNIQVKQTPKMCIIFSVFNHLSLHIHLIHSVWKEVFFLVLFCFVLFWVVTYELEKVVGQNLSSHIKFETKESA